MDSLKTKKNAKENFFVFSLKFLFKEKRIPLQNIFFKILFFKNVSRLSFGFFFLDENFFHSQDTFWATLQCILIKIFFQIKFYILSAFTERFFCRLILNRDLVLGHSIFVISRTLLGWLLKSSGIFFKSSGNAIKFVS